MKARKTMRTLCLGHDVRSTPVFAHEEGTPVVEVNFEDGEISRFVRRDLVAAEGTFVHWSQVPGVMAVSLYDAEGWLVSEHRKPGFRVA